MSTSIEAHSREERKVITALCADLAGSTALSARLDPEDAREIIGGALARVIMVIEQLGRTIKDLAGDGVLALFGAPVPTRTTKSEPFAQAFGSSVRSHATRRR
jgi:class 3 adenylate cyclase